ncbi:MAG: TonB-dependent receptor [Candidatus Zixiibacteriota bacterium]|nr:MAG: TonB-dependent receptor [candidate division Zixibacteria bacterium]
MKLSPNKFGAITVALLTLFLFGGALAGTVGKIMGVVTDKSTGEGIPGVSVQLEGTSIGAATTFDGSYVILNVRPGDYTINARTIGYNQVTQTDVKVKADVTTELNFDLHSVAEKVEDIIVEAEAPAIDKYVTTTEIKKDADDIAHMPVTNVSDVLRTTSGFVSQGGRFHARGGRGGEISYMVDGIEIKNVLGGYGSTLRDNLDISATDISELSVLKGNYDAEYGGSNSAIINIVRKEGDIRATTGRIEFLTDDFGFNELNKYSFNSDRLEWNLSGPVPAVSDRLFPALGLKWPGEKMAYFISFSADKSDNWVDYNNYDAPSSKINYGEEKFLGIAIPSRRQNQYTGSAKITWKMDANARYRLSVNYFKTWQDITGFAYQFLYTPQTAPTQSESKELYGATFSFSPTFLKDTFGELKINRYVQKFEQKPGGQVPGDFVMSDNYERYIDANNNGRWDPAEPFIDYYEDGFFGEPFEDVNRNGIYEPFVDNFDVNIHDLDGDSLYDDNIGEPFSDLNGNGVWDVAEVLINDRYWDDVNGNGIFDEGDSAYTDPEGFGNGVYDPQLRDVINEDRPEPFIDGDVILGEPYIDVDLNGYFNGLPNDPVGPDIFIGAWDLNHNGRHDGPDDPYVEGVPYRDLNNNGIYDAPNTVYDYGEEYVDLNGNGRFDYSDLFWDHGFDQWALYHRTNQTIYTFDLNLTSQVAKQHEVKSGVKFQDLTLEMNEVQYPHLPYDGDPDGGDWPERGVFRDFYTRKPKQGSFYIRDKMEYGEMIANIGFRYDFYIQANELLGDPGAVSETVVESNIYSSQNKFQPRVAFSFPVSDKAKLFFNYGHFYQLPEFRYFFRRPTQASNAFGIVGNPNLSFEKTISYELGIQTRIGIDYILTISGFYKDYYGLLNSIRETYGPISTDVYGNIDYSRTRGFEFSVEKRYGHFFAGELQYEYTYAFGKNSTNSADYFRRFRNQEIPISERPLDWDIRHQITLTGDIRAAKGRHPKIGVFKLPDDWALNFIWQFKTGKPFTPNENYPGLVLIGQQEPLTNSRRMPFTSTVDLRFDKNFQIWKLNYTATVRVDNLFDNTNVNDVYESTGLATTNMNDNGQIITGFSPRDDDPANFDAGRNIRFGLSLNF